MAPATQAAAASGCDARREFQQQAALLNGRPRQLGNGVRGMEQRLEIFRYFLRASLIADVAQVDPDLAAMVKQFAAALQYQRGAFEFRASPQGGLHKIKELLALV